MSGQALLHALELAETPALVGMLRRQQLPGDVLALIRIAADNDAAIAEAAARTGRSRAALREAAILYLQQVLFQPGADAYRTLGASSQATQEELGQHMRWLMKWLHPDHDRDSWESAFAERVSVAWDSLKTAERRAAYDRANPAPQKRGSSRRRRRPGPFLRLPRFAPTDRRHRGRGARFAAGTALAVAALFVAATFFFLPDGNVDRLLGAIGVVPTAAVGEPSAARDAIGR